MVVTISCEMNESLIIELREEESNVNEQTMLDPCLLPPPSPPSPLPEMLAFLCFARAYLCLFSLRKVNPFA